MLENIFFSVFEKLLSFKYYLEFYIIIICNNL